MLLLGGALLAFAGCALLAYGLSKYLRRLYVVKVRMPLIRKYRYRPKRPRNDVYRLDTDDIRNTPENGESI